MALLRPYVISDVALSNIAASLLGITGKLTERYDHKGLYRLARWLTPLFSDAKTVDIEVVPGLTIAFPTNAYWLRMLAAGYEYEAELGRLFYSLKSLPYLFFDCGANIGYWSALVGHNIYGSKQGAAVEAGSQAFEMLKNNLTQNSLSIIPHHLALSDQDDETVILNFVEGSHCDAGASIVSDNSFHNARMEQEQVQTITLDRLIRQTSEDDNLPLVIKLDIEGMEERVMRSSKEMAARDCLIIAEDHGNDPLCKVTKCLWAEGYKVAYVEEKSGGFWVEDLAKLQRVKTNPGKGYNVVALKNSSCFEPYVDNLTISS